VGKVYTFTLDAGSNLSLNGNTSVQFMASRLILAENLTATTTTNGTDMTIRWTSPGDTVVEFWNVRCYNNASGYEEQLSVTETEAYLTGIDPAYSYTVEVTAAGMTEPARTSITANPLNITSLSVDDSAVDTLQVSWEFAGAAPEAWLLMYSVDGSTDLNVIKCDTPAAAIAPKIPGANYQLTIQSVDGTSIFSNVHTYTCPDAPAYDQNSIKAENITASLLKTPEDPSWNFDRVGRDALTDQFALGDRISIVLEANVDFYLPGTPLDILYVIRDEYGNVLPEYLCEAQDNWKQVWNGGNTHYGELDLPSAPDKAGSYVLSIYFSGDFIATTSFTIAE